MGLPADDLVDAVLSTVHPPGSLVLHLGRVLRAAQFRAPQAHRLAELGLGTKQLSALVRSGELARIGPGIYLLPGAEQAAVEVLAALPSPGFTLSEAREALHTTRRVRVPLPELLARHGRTVRTATGVHRLLG